MPTSPGPKSRDAGWEPSASIDALRARADLLQRIRAFFNQRGVLEVETPALSQRAVTDVHLASLSALYRGPGVTTDGLSLFLVTSPELAMKRLLATGSGPIFQIARAFRDGERGRQHNPEFTLLEWYRPGFDGVALQEEVAALLREVAGAARCDRRSYASLFEETLALDPHRAGLDAVIDAMRRTGLQAPPPADADEGLQLLFSHSIEPRLAASPAPVIVFDYPRGQAALARLSASDPPVAERFEVYWRGLELANGFHELTDAAEQRRRFERDREQRHRRGLPVPLADERFLSALEAGLPECSGVALGVDRLLMAMLGARSIDEVLAFPIERA
ncbi:MAG TPA: EF-P lysine aminoacylase EpmA [Thermoanaerobaculia bacterium]|nr:EF-P lysine aminoacylase EpmA [Thermoanaerobaculia bacterium]